MQYSLSTLRRKAHEADYSFQKAINDTIMMAGDMSAQVTVNVLLDTKF